MCLLVLGCKTRSIEPTQPIGVPPGLTQEQVAHALLNVLVSDEPASEETTKDGLTSGERIADKALGVALWPFYRREKPRPPRDHEWFLESIEPGLAIAGYQRRRNYLRVEIHFDTDLVSLRIAAARNLRYTPDSRIHKAAFLWIEELETDIRRSLGRRAALNQ